MTLDVLALRVGVHSTILSRAERGLARLRPAAALRVVNERAIRPGGFDQATSRDLDRIVSVPRGGTG